jgi:putative transposase
MKVEQRESRSITALCSLLDYSRQAYYQQKKQSEKTSLQFDFLIKEVLEIRKNQKRLGGRKLLHKLEPFILNHHIEIGRDAFFNLLYENNLLN